MSTNLLASAYLSIALLLSQLFFSLLDPVAVHNLSVFPGRTLKPAHPVLCLDPHFSWPSSTPSPPPLPASLPSQEVSEDTVQSGQFHLSGTWSIFYLHFHSKSAGSGLSPQSRLETCAHMCTVQKQSLPALPNHFLAAWMVSFPLAPFNFLTRMHLSI